MTTNKQEKKQAGMSKVMLVDDEVLIARQLEESLRGLGYEVVGKAYSGEEACDKAKRVRPDVILMDIVMAGELDGIAAAEIIKAELDIPVIFVTAYVADELVQRAKRVEPSGYIVKPFQLYEVKAALEVAVYNKMAEQRLRERAKQYESALRAGRAGIWDWHLDTNEVRMDSTLKGLLGYEDDEIRDRLEGWGKRLHPEDLEKVMREAEAHIEAKRPQYEVEYRMAHRNGKMQWFLARGAAMRDNKGRAYRMLGVHLDITRRKQMEEELRQAHHALERRVEERTSELLRTNAQLQKEVDDRKRTEERMHGYQAQLRSLASELVFAEEKERRQLAVDLHDSIGQILATAKFKLETMRQKELVAELAAGLDEVRTLMGQAIEHTRSLTFELSPPLLYELGLEAALGSLADRVQRLHGIVTNFTDDEEPKTLNMDVRIVVFRAVQELLINIVKHSQAKTAAISIWREGDSARVLVVDDGVGFDVSTLVNHVSRTSGFGLFSIKERLHHLGGHMDIDSEPGGGTRITLTAPLERGAREGS
jgi:PAS domain S-box-containing protein